MKEEQPNRTIHILPDVVATRIAAGEVVERPAAVVRELVDNSLDAGSTMVRIDVEEGGKRLIRVTDDGEGMNASDAPIACRRFATSKLSTEDDLFGIRTFGFRGEALPSIAAVSRFRLLTACRGETLGTSVQIEGGGESVLGREATSSGTQVEVRNLFFNTPGRQKFLKSTSTEFSHICQVVQQAALARHKTHFRLLHKNRLVLEFSSVPTKADRILQLYRGTFVESAFPISMEGSGLQVEGMTVSPYFARTSRIPQDIFVNDRPVKNATILHAAYEAYSSFLPKGRHPVFVIFVKIDPTQVDVNVHPAKREVKFAQSDMVHQLVKEAVRRPLHQQGVGFSQPGTISEQQMPSSQSEVSGRAGDSHSFGLKWGSVEGSTVPASAYETQGSSPIPKAHGGGTVHDSLQQYELQKIQDVIVLGQVNRTFLIAQVDSLFYVFDQHTIHERVLYERLWRGWLQQEIPSQPLLIPEPVDLPPHAAVLLSNYLKDLALVGLEIEPFGAHSFIIRSVPSLLGTCDYGALVADLLDDLSKWENLQSLEEKVKQIFASMACQGAVQAGRSMEHSEIKQVIEDWIGEGNPMTCPHGRRVAMRFSMDELHHIFGRS